MQAMRVRRVHSTKTPIHHPKASFHLIFSSFFVNRKIKLIQFFFLFIIIISPLNKSFFFINFKDVIYYHSLFELK